jgi:hypothetical protein
MRRGVIIKINLALCFQLCTVAHFVGFLPFLCFSCSVVFFPYSLIRFGGFCVLCIEKKVGGMYNCTTIVHRVGEKAENQRESREKSKVVNNQVFCLDFSTKKRTVYTPSASVFGFISKKLKKDTFVRILID